jgi:periplasmic divalent cation tolerance protein
MYQVVLCTCPDEKTAHAIANMLVSEKLAACVNIFPNVTSVYMWEKKLESASEVKLFIKTEASKLDILSQRIADIHPYDVPEIVALNIQQGNNDYLNWITESLK